MDSSHTHTRSSIVTHTHTYIHTHTNALIHHTQTHQIQSRRAHPHRKSTHSYKSRTIYIIYYFLVVRQKQNLWLKSNKTQKGEHWRPYYISQVIRIDLIGSHTTHADSETHMWITIDMYNAGEECENRGKVIMLTVIIVHMPLVPVYRVLCASVIAERTANLATQPERLFVSYIYSAQCNRIIHLPPQECSNFSLTI